MKIGDLMLVRGNFDGRLGSRIKNPILGMILQILDFENSPQMYKILLSTGKIIIKNDHYLDHANS